MKLTIPAERGCSGKLRKELELESDEEGIRASRPKIRFEPIEFNCFNSNSLSTRVEAFRAIEQTEFTIIIIIIIIEFTIVFA